MIISRAPVRVTLGGGGTDLASYYSRSGGFLIAGAVDRYIHICLNRRFQQNLRLAYSETEIVESVDAVKHPLFRACLELLGLRQQLEIVSIADIPSNCGLGTSSSFTVALLNALHTFKRDFISLRTLAEEACLVEIDRLGEPIGKQDQYMAAFGGVTCLTFDTDGTVHVEPLRISGGSLAELERNILTFYTGVERSASEILSGQSQRTEEGHGNTIDALDTIKEIGLKTREALEGGHLDAFGDLLHAHWETKKQLSSRISEPFLDECYEEARKAGALGGKIMGAGGGGFFIFYCSRDQDRVVDAMKKFGLQHTRFRFDFEGAKIVVNVKGN